MAGVVQRPDELPGATAGLLAPVDLADRVDLDALGSQAPPHDREVVVLVQVAGDHGVVVGIGQPAGGAERHRRPPFGAGFRFATDWIDMGSSRYSPRKDWWRQFHIDAAIERGEITPEDVAGVHEVPS